MILTSMKNLTLLNRKYIQVNKMGITHIKKEEYNE